MASSYYSESPYGVMVYGGADEGLPHLRWAFEVDWDNDGAFTGENEAGMASGLSLTRGREFLVSPNGTGFERVDVGEFTITLENYDGRYTPRNVNSPLYPNVLPLRRCRLWLRTVSGNTWQVMHGVITDIKPIEGDAPRVRITVRDWLQWLRDHPASASMRINGTTDQAMTDILTAAGYPYPTDLDSSTTRIGYWWSTDGSAATQLFDLADSELGTFFIAADGTAKFYTRHHTYTVMASLDGTDVQRQLSTSQPWEVVRNIIQVTSHPKELQATGVLWSLSDVITVQNGETVAIWGNYAYNTQACPATNVLAPVSGTDFAMNTSADGTGTNVTANFTVTAARFGSSVKYTITNNYVATAYITLLQIRGDAITTPDPVTISYEDTDSQDVYGQRVLTVDFPWLQNTNTALDFSKYLCDSFSVPKDIIRVIIKNDPDTQFGIDLFDKVTLLVPEIGANSDYRVIKITHNWIDKTGFLIETEWLLEPYVDSSISFWKFPATVGTDTIFSY